ncbi:hypothetical protein QCN29_14910 [Streptomyces sp. HNM0663]|uniref:Uncharacterized protein n=1 Tax=Streptomyces chengmaiensis TaxID=3040919 RepID=A0ABT6HMW3_9ACTN|nr:hypothetical protein [Streptomyces chengmaiensis]MDH2390058.1 hypothetical protein [Streptomyces chengmaiensis]
MSEINASQGDPQQETVAYLMGSFWFCPPCARERDDIETLMPARRADLMDVYGVPLRPVREAHPLTDRHSRTDVGPTRRRGSRVWARTEEESTR